MESSTNRSSDRERLEQTVRTARREGESRTGQIGSSAILVRLASRLGIEINDLCIRLSSDVVRRTKYPVIEDKHADGSITYRAPVDVIEGPRTG
jgi:hypothetical protein